ncbi:MAG: WhiB family transcriptional regulator, partial [Cetobacterium sp.]
MTDRDWRAQAACLGLNPELWFAERGDQPAREAKRICYDCPVREPCTEYAVTAREEHGIWGGLTPRELRRLRTARRRLESAAEHRIPEHASSIASAA